MKKRIIKTVSPYGFLVKTYIGLSIEDIVIIKQRMLVDSWMRSMFPDWTLIKVFRDATLLQCSMVLSREEFEAIHTCLVEMEYDIDLDLQ